MLHCNYSEKYNTRLSLATFNVLAQASGKRSLRELLTLAEISEDQKKDVLADIIDLWSRRLIVMRPIAADAE
jgi:hypothetical protein